MIEVKKFLHSDMDSLLETINNSIDSGQNFYLLVGLENCLACEELKFALREFLDSEHKVEGLLLTFEIKKMRDLRRLNLAITSFPTLLKYANGALAGGWTGALPLENASTANSLFNTIFS